MSEKSTKKPRFNGSYIALAAMVLIVVFVWRDLAETKKAQDDLAQKNLQLLEELSDTRKELNTLKSARLDQPVSSKQTTRQQRQTAQPIEEPEAFFLQPPSVSDRGGELTARFKFEPEENTPLPEQITLVVRVPGNTDAKIISLKPVDSKAFSGVEFLVNAQGSLGMIEGSPSDVAALEFEVTVSAPVAVTIRGSKGIKDFEMDISRSGCTVRKL
ncbi:hypothetical protein P4C99_03285 [Pontiellaceae bacterium B1224]|nr:hypothetical protein [Pontiellaceae bacterium B1224]